MVTCPPDPPISTGTYVVFWVLAALAAWGLATLSWVLAGLAWRLLERFPRAHMRVLVYGFALHRLAFWRRDPADPDDDGDRPDGRAPW